MQVDLSTEVRRQVPLLLEKMVETPIFITGKFKKKEQKISINHISF